MSTITLAQDVDGVWKRDDSSAPIPALTVDDYARSAVLDVRTLAREVGMPEHLVVWGER